MALNVVIAACEYTKLAPIAYNTHRSKLRNHYFHHWL